MTREVEAEVHRLDEHRGAVLKARVIDADRPAGHAVQAVDEESIWGRAGAVEPPYNPEVLVALLEHSNSLRQNVDAYVVNVHAHGHRFEPVIDLNSDDANTQIANLIFASRQRRERDPAVADPSRQAELPTEEEVLAARKELEEQMRMEKMRLKHFFQNASLDISFESLRMRTAMDVEVQGNGYWEVLRDASGDIAQFNHIRAYTMRLMPLDPDEVEVEERVKLDEVTWGEISVRKRFRRYVQVIEEEAVYFKELGDPRLVSHKTGGVYPSEGAMAEAEPEARPAAEVLHFAIPSQPSPYGVPRWIGVLLSVLGSRQVDEVNYDYFDKKAVPPLVFLVSGGRMTEETVDRIRDHITSGVKGKQNFHKVLVIEAEGASTPMNENSGRARIEMKPLTQAMHQDALFQKYDERNMDKVGMAFRLPRMLRGDIRDFNRATADAALEFAEMQVFAPERDDFDFLINRKVLPRLGIRFFQFKSNSPKLTDPMDLGKLVGELTKEGVLTPAEARQEAEKVFNRELRNINSPWTRQPLSLTLAGIAPPAEDMLGPGEKPEEDEGEAEAGPAAQGSPGIAKLQHGALLQDATYLIRLRNALAEAEAVEAERAFASAKAAEDDAGDHE